MVWKLIKRLHHGDEPELSSRVEYGDEWEVA